MALDLRIFKQRALFMLEGECAFVEKEEQTKKRKNMMQRLANRAEDRAILLAFLCVFSSSLFALS
jgi:hypothetical protein